MNFDSFSRRFIKRIVVLDILIGDNSSLKITCCSFRRSKGSVLLESSHTCESIDHLPLDRIAGAPVLVSINGKGIVQKMYFDNDERSNSDSLLQVISDEFYRSISKHDHFTGVVFCRRETIDNLIGKLIDYKLQIIDISFGVLCTIPFLSISGAENCFIGHGYGYSGGTITDAASGCEESVNLMGVNVNCEHVLSYIIALTYFMVGKVDPTLELPKSIQRNRNSYLASVRNFPIFSFAGAILLTLLVVNLSVKDNLESRLSESHQSLYRIKQQQKKELEQRSKSEVMKTEAGRVGSIFDGYPFILDRIGYTKPKGITLQKLNINPLSTKISDNQEVLVKNRVLFISGVAINPSDVSNWVNALGGEKWIDRIIISSLIHSESLYIFELEITFKDV